MTKRINYFALILCSVLQTVAFDRAYCSVIHVPADYPTIQAAIDAADTDSEIILADGIYTGDGNWDILIRRDDPLTIRSENGPSNCTIECQTVTPYLQKHSGFKLQYCYGTIKISGLTIRNARYPISLDSSSAIINRCIIEGAEYHGVYVKNGSIEDTTFIKNTVIENCRKWAVSATGFVEIDHCTLSGNSNGIYLYSDQLNISNSIIWGCTNYALGKNTYATINVNYCNIDVANVPVGIDWVEGNINLDPGFVSAETGVYELKEFSPCINSGDPFSEPAQDAKDLAGNPRKSLNIVDMGAYEFATSEPFIDLSSSKISISLNADTSLYGSATLGIQNISSGVLHWEINEQCEWLSVNPATGQSDGNINEISVDIDATGLSRGVYTYPLKVSRAGFPDSYKICTIILYVDIPEGLYVPWDYETIQDAIDAAGNGDNIIVFPGRYAGDGNSDLNFHRKAITLRSLDPTDSTIVKSTIIDCQHDFSAVTFDNGEGHDSILDGLTFENCGYSTVVILAESSPTIMRCNIIESSSVGIYIGSGCSPVITHCKIGNCWDAGIHCKNTNSIKDTLVRIDNCIIYGNSPTYKYGGVYIEDDSVNVNHDVVITNCTVTGNGSSYSECGGGVTFLNSGNNRSATCRIFNSIVYDNQSPQGIEIWGDIEVSYSDVKGGFEGVGNFDFKPFFTDASIGDYSLTRDSFCINSGFNDYVVSNQDVRLGDRILGGKVDVGAFETDYECPRLGLSVKEFHFHANPYWGNPDDQSFYAGSTCEDSLIWDFIEDCEWLNLNRETVGTGVNWDKVTLSVDLSSLEIGSYEYDLVPVFGGQLSDTQIIKIYFEVYEPPLIGLSSDSVVFTSQEGIRNPEDQLFYVSNIGSSYLLWSISEECTWLNVTPTSGRSTGEQDQVKLSVNVNGLEPGYYNDEFVVSCDKAGIKSITVPVSLEVSSPAISVLGDNYFFKAVVNSEISEEMEFSINNVGGGTLNWWIEHDSDWLILSSESGKTQGETDIVSMSLDISNLSVGYYDCTVFVYSDQTPDNPHAIDVELYVHCEGPAVFNVPNDFPNIAMAVKMSLDGDTVLVEDGTYAGDGNRDIDLEGMAITVRSKNGQENCIIDCQGTSADKHRGFLITSGEQEGTVIDGFTIKNGYAYSGAGLLSSNSSPVIRNCKFTNCVAENDGGAIYSSGGSGKILDCIFEGNSASYIGGAIKCRFHSEPLISGCVITGNKAGGHGGGGIAIFESNAKILNCIISNNISDNVGGGVLFHNESGEGSIIKNCVICKNTSINRGGGVAGCSGAITNCTIVGNSASNGISDWPGGGLYDCTGTISNNIIWDNGPDEIFNCYGPITYNCFAGGLNTNIDTDPLFTNDYHLKPSSPCIDAGYPASDFGLEPEPDGGQINMGAYGNTAEAATRGGFLLPKYDFLTGEGPGIVVVNHTRVSRSIFIYEAKVKLRNTSPFDVRTLELKLLAGPDNMSMIDQSVTFDFIKSGNFSLSDDTFIFEVDHTGDLDMNQISWKVFDWNVIRADFNGDQVTNSEDIIILASQWLNPHGDHSADIAYPYDGIVNLRDFEVLASQWLEE